MNKIIDGKEISNELKEEITEEIKNIKTKLTLAVIQVGNNPASDIYVRNKKKLCESVGINFVHKKYDDISEENLIKEINKLNKDKKITSILVQLPLPKNINEKNIIEQISPLKDVDGLTSNNIGKLFSNQECITPCTSLGVLELLKRKNIKLERKKVVIVGRSKLVGLPLISLMLKENATVTVCHSKTKNLKEETKTADILVVAVGSPKLIKKDYIKENSVVIDVGINRIEDKICGDVEFDKVKEKVKLITPVPGGVGPMTVAMLANNVVKCYKLQKNIVEK